MKSKSCPACKELIESDSAVCPFCGLDIAANRRAFLARQHQEDLMMMQKVKSEQKLFGVPYETASEQAKKLSAGRMLGGIALTGAGVVAVCFFVVMFFVELFGSPKNEVLTAIMAYLSLVSGCITALGVRLLTPPKDRPLIMQAGQAQEGTYPGQPENSERPVLQPPPEEYQMGGSAPQPEQQIRSIYEAPSEDGRARFNGETGSE